ncbi:glycosyltransferase [Dehalococcoidales bacterium]|nr:glycosyltransferase [Dehalococcoidales bacterium]
MAELSKSQSISINLHESSQPLLSIIITSYTTERLGDIYELLNSIKAQSYPDIETIFIAEHSTELYERVKEYGEEIFRDSVETGRDSVEIRSLNLDEAQPIPKNLLFKVLFNDGEPGLSAARNLGIKEAKGDIIAFVDDDVVLFPDWAEEMINAYQGDSIIGVTGPAFPLWEDESMSWLPEELYWIISCTAWCDWNQTREVRNAWGMNMSFRREAFDAAGLFQPAFGLRSSNRAGWRDPPSEDNDLSIRVKRTTGKRIVYNPNIKVRHRVYKYRLTKKFVSQRSYSVGYQRRMMKRLYPEAEKGKDLLSQEHQLLKRIFTRLFPNILRGFFSNPIIAWRKLRVTLTALTFVTLGYYSHLLYPFNHQTKITRGGK